ncbi:hypothetical protein FBU30_001428, partial [Linnemannia zychae]
MKFTSTTLAFLATTTSILIYSSHAAATLDQCSISLLGLVSDPGLNSCLPMQKLTQLVSATITPQLVNDTAATFCELPICPDSSVSLVRNTISQNCVNASDPATAELVYGAASLYPPFREGLCAKIPGGNGTYCVAEAAETLSDYLAKHPSPLGIKIFANSTVLKQYVDEMPASILCTPCNKAIINPIDNYIAGNKDTLTPQIVQWANILQSEAQAKCGADFTDGKKPTPTGGATPTGGSKGGSGASTTQVGGSMFALMAVV